MSDDNGSDNLINTISSAAVALHEMYVSLVAAGFTRDEALRIVIDYIRPQGNA